MWNNDNPFDFNPLMTQWLREEEVLNLRKEF